MKRRLIVITLALLFCSSSSMICRAQQPAPLPKLDPKVYDPYLGAYQLPSDELIVIGRTERRLYLHEPRTGRVRGLELVSGTSFRAGPSLLIFSPAELQITFNKNRNGAVTSLTLKETGAPARVARKANLYREEQVRFGRTDGVMLAGTLLTPTTRGPHPAVILLHGSGQQDRNGYLSVMRFAADHFARHGIAALIYDKRGSGASGGNWATATFDDMAADALSALTLLQKRQGINTKQIGMWGSSQAGWVLAKATSMSKEIAFVISVSAGGSGYTVAQQELYNVTTEMRAAGFSQSEIDEVIATRNLLFDFVRSGRSEQYDAAIRRAQQNAKIKDWLTPLSGEIDLQKRDQWFLALDIDFDPMPLWERYEGPVLGLFGELDTSTPVKQVVPIFAKALASRKNTDFAIKVFPKAHHIILEARTGSDSELERLKRYVPGYFDTMTDWLRTKVWPRAKD
ncbi:MAG TPA: alpha/beta fold hydrolase [Pyrinomonadaceae bacterium]|jgi:pimeloyl-ACP methyl ester carboxylesterase|nr:alpha/beta fold hydrolase [Pyrinomonadaceae bacterium]